MHRRTITQQDSGDASSMLPADTQRTRSPHVPMDAARDCFHTITTFANEAIQSAGTTFAGFQGAMKDILPKLNEEERNECFNTFIQYHQLLMTTQRFVTRTHIRINRAHRTNELLQSIDLSSIRDLCVEIRGLLNRFKKIQAIIDSKIKDERTVLNCRDCFLGRQHLC